MTQAVFTEVAERIGYITLNRPDKRNALGPELILALHEAFLAMRANDSVKVIVLKSTGKAFCAGADLGYLQQLQDFSYEENLEDSKRLMELFKLIYDLPKVVIAQVQGHALAGGCGLVTVCDFAFAVPDALFGYTEVRIGFVPALVSVFLQEQIGAAKTQELLLSGELINSSKAAELGLITSVEPTEFLEKSVHDFAQKLLVQNSGFSMAETKSFLRSQNEQSRAAALSSAAELNAKARAHADCKKGIAAFLSKNTPNW
ncbi:enoyl-CoA hydratase-related protein [Algoriphagus halophytocola]|uniref:Enoyl-CoA hydratase-related protein n=1 Tax=Algoriphagus halophytocola TaxID=2991499 RepID=A0ABY6MLJ0_9BACT|nr:MULTISPECIES: enoyl-CoA hydratase-related protein [unclassified Algoriphagus]UZD24627.1 enoyl-CoA hydratase-related protein [Algoriphagus sp. TR-M5]WBL41995.1 enoyl-CoA hydratase-related protein [Algoriphagus sp. TR-M9]